ncbi:MAG: FlgD immunoglobulin-like domain containing protein [Candidatus Eisenbacteria bacterium]
MIRHRWLPACAVTLLLAAALIAPSPGVRAERSAPDLDALYYPICTPIQQTSSAGVPWVVSIEPVNGIAQPLGPVENFATCSLTVQPSTYVHKRLDVVYWDPVAMAPDPTTVALRTRTYWPTGLATNASRFDLLPPVITRTLPGLAEPPPAETAVEYRVLSNSNAETASFDADGPESIPEAMWIRAGSLYQPMGGEHPVFLHSVCGGDGVLQSHYVAQSVMTTNAEANPVNVQFIQKFRVPAVTSLRWVELVFKPHSAVGYLDRGLVFVADAAGQPVPPMTFGTSLVQAEYHFDVPDNAWYSHYDFPSFPVLQPDHDYWLVVNTQGDYKLGARVRTGAESPYFTNGVGPYFERASAGSSPVLVPNRSLNFRIIGVPVGTVGVSPERPRQPLMHLAVAPNPTRGAAMVTWSGARDAVRFEVLDARGRRVASGAAGKGATGQWSWSGTGDDGRALPAGVYFVRARDAAGRAASARVTLVR